MQQREKEININVSKILNWPESQGAIKFQLIFSGKSDGHQIASKTVKAHYLKDVMHLNACLKIKYTQQQFLVILRLAYRMGLGGQTILGDFDINLQTLHKRKQLKFLFGSTNHILIIEEYNSNPNNTDKRFIEVDLKQLQKHRKSNNADFIRQKEEFLQNYSNRSRSNSQSRDQNLNKKLSSSLNSQFYNEQNGVSVQYGIQSQQTFRPRLPYQVASSSNRNQNYSQNKSLRQLNIKKSYSKDSETSKKSSSSQKYVLFVKNLNIVPLEQYYQQKSHNKNSQNSMIREHKYTNHMKYAKRLDQYY